MHCLHMNACILKQKKIIRSPKSNLLPRQNIFATPFSSGLIYGNFLETLPPDWSIKYYKNSFILKNGNFRH